MLQRHDAMVRWHKVTIPQWYGGQQGGKQGTADKHNNQMETGDSVKDDNEDEEDKDDSGDNYKENEDDKDKVKVGGEVEVEQRLGMQQSN